MSKEWRNHLTEEAKHKFMTWVVFATNDRMNLGEKTYGSQFQGEPLLQLAEELFDSLKYVWVAMAQMSELEAENKALREAMSKAYEQFGCGDWMSAEATIFQALADSKGGDDA